MMCGWTLTKFQSDPIIIHIWSSVMCIHYNELIMPRAYYAKRKITVCVIVYELNCLIKITMSLTALQPLMDSLVSEIQQLRSAIGAVQLNADSAGLASPPTPLKGYYLLLYLITIVTDNFKFIPTQILPQLQFYT